MKHKGTIRLETDRLILRPFKIEDAEDVFNNWASDDEVTKYLTWPTHSGVEMSRSYMEFCINEYNEKNVYQCINNPNSGRVMQKIGMKYEGTLRQSGKNNQGIVDMAHYSVLKEEWEKRF